MAMDGNELGALIANAITHSSAPPEVKASVLSLWKTIGTVIVNYIKNNAEVPAGIKVTTSGGDGSTSGPGTVQ